ncbi:MAG: inorganic phosphate transporter [Bacteroidota bacterium]
MPDLYLIIVTLLFVLAISDLIVGVSNDAVNFLNSSIGSKVAPRHIIMIVASIGIFVGATFSSGMMEVARKGIFNPDHFYFSEVMVIFLAVMLTDIILLDFFNTIGLPTSTTVSIVFELLGAAVIISLVKISANGQGLAELNNYINSSQATLIISGIFLSVIFAFLTGTLIQFISRYIFSFQYKQKKRFIGALWSALALSLLTYFLLFKGIKGASFATESFVALVSNNMALIMSVSTVIWAVVLYFLSRKGVNIFRIIVLFGTFALAMAFAGNDLVNFIGVAIAGFESYTAWGQSGQEASNYTMEVLTQPVRTNTLFLIAAGGIMITTLWFSKKARSVTETEVNLGRQNEGHERFQPNALARGIVRYISGAVNLFRQVLPTGWLEKAGKSFEPLPKEDEDKDDKPAFDLIRASVNLTAASVLIALATSLKLPLSTTYVSFMVAMGTSLADRAWGRDSAVYRVAGVLNVIGGWFATAIIAFVVSGVFALLIYYLELAAITLLIAAAVFFIYRSFHYHKKKEKKNETRVAFEGNDEKIAFEKLFSQLSERIANLLSDLIDIYDQAHEGLIKEQRNSLTQASRRIKRLEEKNDNLQYELYGSVRRIDESDSEGSRMFLYVFDLEQDIIQSTKAIVGTCHNHVNNMLSPLKAQQVNDIQRIQKEVSTYLSNAKGYLDEGNSVTFEKLINQKEAVLLNLEEALKKQVEGIKSETYGARNSQLIFKLLLESKDIVAVATRFVKLQKRLSQAHEESSQSYLSFSYEKEEA